MDYLSKLPTELLVLIFKQLDGMSRLCLNGTNRRLRYINLNIPIAYLKMGEVLPYMINHNYRINRTKISRLQQNLKMFPGIKYLSFNPALKTHKKRRSFYYQMLHSRWNFKRRMNRNLTPFLKKLNRKKASTLKNVQCLELNSWILNGKIDSYMLNECTNLKYLLMDSKYRNIVFDSTFADSPTLKKIRLLKFNGCLKNPQYFVNHILPKCHNLKYLEIPYGIGYVFESPTTLEERIISSIVNFKSLKYLKLSFGLTYENYIHILKALPNLDHIEFEINTANFVNCKPYKHNNLRSLKISETWMVHGWNEIDLAYTNILQGVPNLESLTLDRIHINDQFVQFMTTSLPCLKYLSLQLNANTFTEIGFKCLITGCLKLEVLHLSFQQDFLTNLHILLAEFIKTHEMLKMLQLFTDDPDFDITNLKSINKCCNVKHFNYDFIISDLPSKYEPIQDFILNDINKQIE